MQYTTDCECVLIMLVQTMGVEKTMSWRSSRIQKGWYPRLRWFLQFDIEKVPVKATVDWCFIYASDWIHVPKSSGPKPSPSTITIQLHEIKKTFNHILTIMNSFYPGELKTVSAGNRTPPRNVPIRIGAIRNFLTLRSVSQNIELLNLAERVQQASNSVSADFLRKSKASPSLLGSCMADEIWPEFCTSSTR